MESAVPMVRFVKCPKCLKILAEFAEVPVYKCGGCGAILRAKVQPCSGQNLSPVSTNPASRNSPAIDPLSDEFVKLGVKTILDVSDSSGESSLMAKSLDNEHSGKELEQCLEANSETNEILKSSDKLNESFETKLHYTTSKDDKIKLEFSYETRSSTQDHDLSSSSTDEDRKVYIPPKPVLSRRTFRSKYVSDSLDITEAGEKSIPDNKAIDQGYTKVKVNHTFSEQDDQVNILNKVDELRNELRGLFNETANDNGLQVKNLPTEYRSAPLPFSSHPNSHAGYRLSEPLHLLRNTIYQGPQDVHPKASISQSILRLCRPISGGAPFVICCKCFKMLQLPSDFLVSQKKVHKLRCGSCLQVLRFSFRPKNSEVIHTPASLDNENSMSPSGESTVWDPISSDFEPGLNKSQRFDEIVEQECEEGGKVGSRFNNHSGYYSNRKMSFFRPSGKIAAVRRTKVGAFNFEEESMEKEL